MKLKDRIRALMGERWEDVDRPIHPRLRWLPPFAWRLISWLLMAAFVAGAALLAIEKIWG